MPLAIVATAGAANANSYSTVAAADTYHEAHLYATTWTAATSAQKIASLVWATRLLDQHFAWAGTIASQTQALSWPRVGAYDKDGRLLDETTVPVILANATAELGRSLIDANRTNTEDASGSITYLTVGGIGVKYADGSVTNPQVIPDAVRAMVSFLGAFTANTGGGGALSVRRG